MDGDVHGNHVNYSEDYWLLKLAANGDTLWTKCYGGSDDDKDYSIQQTIDGGYIVAGCSIQWMTMSLGIIVMVIIGF